MTPLKSVSINDDKIFLESRTDISIFPIHDIKIIYVDNDELIIVLWNRVPWNFVLHGDKKELMKLCDLLFNALPNEMQIALRKKANPLYAGDRIAQ